MNPAPQPVVPLEYRTSRRRGRARRLPRVAIPALIGWAALAMGLVDLLVGAVRTVSGIVFRGYDIRMSTWMWPIEPAIDLVIGSGVFAAAWLYLRRGNDPSRARLLAAALAVDLGVTLLVRLAWLTYSVATYPHVSPAPSTPGEWVVFFNVPSLALGTLAGCILPLLLILLLAHELPAQSDAGARPATE